MLVTVSIEKHILSFRGACIRGHAIMLDAVIDQWIAQTLRRYKSALIATGVGNCQHRRFSTRVGPATIMRPQRLSNSSNQATAMECAFCCNANLAI